MVLRLTSGRAKDLVLTRYQLDRLFRQQHQRQSLFQTITIVHLKGYPWHWRQARCRTTIWIWRSKREVVFHFFETFSAVWADRSGTNLSEKGNSIQSGLEIVLGKLISDFNMFIFLHNTGKRRYHTWSSILATAQNKQGWKLASS